MAYRPYVESRQARRYHSHLDQVSTALPRRLVFPVGTLTWLSLNIGTEYKITVDAYSLEKYLLNNNGCNSCNSGPTSIIFVLVLIQGLIKCEMWFWYFFYHTKHVQKDLIQNMRGQSDICMGYVFPYFF